MRAPTLPSAGEGPGEGESVSAERTPYALRPVGERLAASVRTTPDQKGSAFHDEKDRRSRLLIVGLACSAASRRRSRANAADKPPTDGPADAAAVRQPSPRAGQAGDRSPSRSRRQAEVLAPSRSRPPRRLATELGAKIKEDADGNVIALDMAAGRSWADDAQMEQILVFEKLQSLTLEGPGITDALVPRIAECENLTSLALRNTLIGDAGIAQLTGLEVAEGHRPPRRPAGHRRGHAVAGQDARAAGRPADRRQRHRRRGRHAAGAAAAHGTRRAQLPRRDRARASSSWPRRSRSAC